MPEAQEAQQLLGPAIAALRAPGQLLGVARATAGLQLQHHRVAWIVGRQLHGLRATDEVAPLVHVEVRLTGLDRYAGHGDQALAPASNVGRGRDIRPT